MLKILQLSDTHLHADVDTQLHGVLPQESFNRLVTKIKSRIEDIDAIFLTGDISQDKAEASYCHIARSLQVFKKPVYWFAGNHDDPQLMHSTFEKFDYFHPLTSLTLRNWQFLVLDTVKKDSDVGYLVENKAALIHDNTFCALLMHHHPTPVGTPLIDKYKLQNPEALSAFLALQKKMPAVIITGHVHGAYKMQFSAVPVVTSPATCFQFSKESTKLALDPQGGCTFWFFNDDGAFNYEYVYT